MWPAVYYECTNQVNLRAKYTAAGLVPRKELPSLSTTVSQTCIPTDSYREVTSCAPWGHVLHGLEFWKEFLDKPKVVAKDGFKHHCTKIYDSCPHLGRTICLREKALQIFLTAEVRNVATGFYNKSMSRSSNFYKIVALRDRILTILKDGIKITKMPIVSTMQPGFVTP